MPFKSKDKSAKRAAKHTPLFDIRLNTVDKDVLILKGSAAEAPPVLLSGVVVMSITEPITVRKMTLQFYATIDMHWDEKFQNSKGMVFTRPFHYNRVIFDYDWDTLNLQQFLRKDPGSGSSVVPKLGTSASSGGFITGHSASAHSSSSSLNVMSSVGSSSTNLRKNKSSSSLGGMLSTTPTAPEPVTLPAGNYEFPFQTVLDGDIKESIDGLRGCSIVYRLQSCIERGRFSTPIMTRKMVHVVRTMRADSAELSETVAVDNTWPGKVDYSISVPTRAIAIGSTLKVNIIMVPLAKGLKLGTVKIKLAEYSSLMVHSAQHYEERNMVTRSIPKVTTNADGQDVWTEAEMDQDGVFYRSPQLVLTQDRWEIQTSLAVPSSLWKCTQDCDIQHAVKVRHKLTFSIGLINTDGHVSELRATLPVILFISPFVPIKVKTLTDFDGPHTMSGYDDATLYSTSDNVIFSQEDAVKSTASSSTNLAASVAMSPVASSSHVAASNTPNTVSPALSSSTTPNQSTTNLDTQDLMAPPPYEQRVFDRLFESNGTEGTAGSAAGSGSSSTAALPTVAAPIPIAGQPVPVPTSGAETASATNPPLYSDLSMTPTSTENAFNIRANLAHSTANSVRRNNRPVFTLAEDEVSAAPTPLGTSPTVISGPAFEGGSINMSQSLSNSGVNLPALMSPAATTPVQHLSRATSFMNEAPSGTSLNLNGLSTGSPPPATSPSDEGTIEWDTQRLSRVPSYSTAIKQDSVLSDEPTPAYVPPNYDGGSSPQLNLELLDSRLKEVPRARLAASKHISGSNSPVLSRTHSRPGLSPKFGSTTSLISKQFHKLHIDGGNGSIPTSASAVHLAGHPVNKDLEEVRPKAVRTSSSPAFSTTKKNKSFGNLSLLHRHS